MNNEYAGATSKCGVPMWQMGTPAGLCGRTAYGEERHYNPLEPPYSSGWRCDHHGGPSEDGIRLITDGFTEEGRPMWMAYFPEFINLAESVAGFGSTKDRAIVDLHSNLAKPVGRPVGACDDCGNQDYSPICRECGGAMVEVEPHERTAL